MSVDEKMNEELEELSDEELLKVYTSDAMKMYIQSISVYPKLSVQEQKELFISGQKEKLVNCMLRLVVSIASKYQYKINNLEMLDIVQEGNIGLLRAVESYNPTLGAFTTYAYPWITSYIINGIKKKEKDMHKPLYIQEAMRKYLKLIEKNTAKGKILTKEEIIKSLEIDEFIYKNLMIALSQNIVSINEKVNQSKLSELGDYVADENAVSESDIINKISNFELIAICKIILKPSYYYVIYYRYLTLESNQKTLEQIAQEFKVKRQAIDSIEKKTLEKIKPYLDNSLSYDILKKFQRDLHCGIDQLKLGPLDLDSVIKYLYIKDDLTSQELKLYELATLSSIKYKDAYYLEKLNINLEELRHIKESIKYKLQKKLRDKEAYLNFKNALVKEHSTLIYKLVSDVEGVILSENNKTKKEEDEVTNFNIILTNLAKNNYYDLLIFLRTVLTPLCYYIYYNLFCLNKTKEEICLELHFTSTNLFYDMNNSKKAIAPFLKNNCQGYVDFINNLKNLYGFNYYFLKTDPIDPKDILTYYYLKDELTPPEKKILEWQLFSPFNYTKFDYAKLLGYSLEEIECLIKSLNEKMNIKFNNPREFERFMYENLESKKGILYRSLPIDKVITSYDDILKKYELLTFEEILNLFSEINYPLTEEEINLLEQYSNISSKEEISLDNKKRILTLLQMLDLKARIKK